MKEAIIREPVRVKDTEIGVLRFYRDTIYSSLKNQTILNCYKLWFTLSEDIIKLFVIEVDGKKQLSVRQAGTKNKVLIIKY